MPLDEFFDYLENHISDDERISEILRKLANIAYSNVYELLSIEGYTKQDVYAQKSSVLELVRLEMQDMLMDTHITDKELDKFSSDIVDDVFRRACQTKEISNSLLSEYASIMNESLVPNDVSTEGLDFILKLCNDASESIKTINPDISKNDFEEHMKDVVTNICDETYNFFLSRGYPIDYSGMINYIYSTVVSILNDGDIDDAPLGFSLDNKDGFTNFKLFANNFYDDEFRIKVFTFILKENNVEKGTDIAKELALLFSMLHDTNYKEWLKNVTARIANNYNLDMIKTLYIINLSLIMLVYLRDPEAEYYLNDIYLPLNDEILDCLVEDFDLNPLDLSKASYEDFENYMQYLEEELGILYFAYFQILKLLEE